MKRRLIFGCGYLGRRVASRWAAAGDTVYAVTRSAERQRSFAADGLMPLMADVTKPDTLDALPDIDTVLVAVGMDRSVYSDIREVYVKGLRNVLDSLSDSVRHVIYVSSTGVYGDFGGEWVDEDSPTDPQREGGKACLEAERLLQNSRWGSRSTILRLAGIYGPDRVPTRQQVVEKQWDRLSPFGYLNLIQVDDGAKVTQSVSDRVDRDGESRDVLAQTFLVSDGQPPLRRDYYDWIANYFNVGPIPWDPNAKAPNESRASSSKRISNQKLLEVLDFGFQYPDFKSGLADALRK